ncbi:MAG: hypothetical protein U0S50_06350 [Sphingopyxis sp.]|uniref:hypothetical protein n=1 Tax=Sphingopyxis sp. TaxID=1908224 RepID=UPI002ABA5DE5|nr:hypothetical protein [Sphingopyxis sp.]MDZ3831422.1 hypothetical protein [Sphingopyxis sp.]
MLFRSALLNGIQAGTVTLAFRRWRRPSVKPGGRLRTAVGELAIDAVERIDATALSERDAVAAGFPDREALLAELAKRDGGDLYRIAFRYAGADPRAALRKNDQLSAKDIAELGRRLARLDERSETPWTLPVMRYIADHEGVAAAVIAQAMRADKLTLKRNVRKLKELGLTESLDTGYRLSPRGQAFLKSVGRMRP